ncbi:HD-GYP domain-containing protein [Thermobrachium celere]|uniref:Uncharacterized protein n=1 Tax=Thermobrachium celere DSM 8682 TaxID=941824 RepID=R7RUJ1_9CLOT|nr:HD-GYP domain-containing protein [Thermobrachium celere]CDF59025.1 hypothetical protein TCEL_02093 [Thermobrachium celere DSM 8682]
MQKKIKLYLYMSIIYALYIYLFYIAFKNNINKHNYISILFFCVLSIVTESLLVVYKKMSISSGFAITLASIMIFGTFYTMIIISFGIALRIFKHNNKYQHIFNIPIYKIFFNVCNIGISVFIASNIYQIIERYSNNNIIKIILQVLLVTISFVTTNILIMSILIAIITNDNLKNVFNRSFSFGLLSVIPMVPFGYLIAYLYNEYNILGILLLMVPVLLVRYTYMLYIESKTKYQETVKVLMTALEMRDKYTEGHSRNVAKIVRAIGEELNYSDSHIEELELAAYLHDIGKIGIPDSILNKPEKLTEDEYKQIKSHTVIGYDIVKGIKDLGKIPELVRHHHERYDGKGYPDGKKGDELDIDVYILQLADSVDAMSTDRIYRKALSPEQIKAELIKNRGLQFHPRIVDIYLKICDKENLCNSRG